MSAKVIPKEQLTAYQRWELAHIEPGAGEPTEASPAAAPADSAEIALPTAEDIERIQQQAWREGYELGMEEGRKAGFDAGMRDGKARLAQLRALLAALDAARLRQDETVAREVLELALAISRQLVRTALQVKPELILGAIQEALLSLPALDGRHTVFTHPDSVEIVREWLAGEHGHLSWKVKEDARLQPGSFRIESAYSELDGDLAIRWREIVECLGSDSAWLS